MSDTHLTAPTRHVDVDGDRFAYRRWGKADSGQPPLLFFQHFRGGMDHWDPLMTDGLAAGREVILYNYRGSASSSGTPRNTIEDMADDAAKVIAALGLSQVDVVGFSLGGMVAQEFTRRHPDRVRRLMLLGTQPRGGNPDPDPKIFEVAPRPIPTVDDFLFLFFGPSEAAKQAGRAFWDRRHQRVDQDPPSSPELMMGQIEANTAFVTPLDPERPFAHLAEITQPTLIVNGVNDVMIATINSWHMVQNIPNAQLIVYPDAGHGAQFQYPERFLKHALQFLED
ncbi:alpha/beta fold hydrolase [Brevundimonas mediterranea]|jgi:pimeloyl-ACP methyl ester carboxylesterase|uniref:Pimeloyl-ACP methyl ester carboxylesterase n=1 Tax=Brevundimonas mediterranea TaxID=74329 RepID=A0A7W6A222_9CAUL|nr:alpha/beta hydrolase [Brevundimonas mediterranea]MBB3870816.1 pimeloyl-ACP methyl ester carboxylesterase [Brevundimonas mediterranea]